MKVTIVGAGNVGATCADAIAYRRIADAVRAMNGDLKSILG